MSENQSLESKTAELSAEDKKVIEESNSKKDKIIKEAKSFAIIIIAVFTFRSIFFEPFRIPSGSMIPTLMIGDFILVNKFAYGFKVPFSDLTLGESINWKPIYLFNESDPKRGDVIVFKYPKEPSVNYIKRVVGMPGDTLEIRNKAVYINDVAISSTEFDGKEILSDMDEKFKGYNLQFFKVKTGEHEHVVQIDKDNYYTMDFEKITIPEGEYFALGDNRDFSADSRYWGFVKKEHIKGRAMFVWFSLIFPFGENNFKFRPHRIGTSIL